MHTLRALYQLTKKNLKLLIRSKSSALIVFLAPLLIILILGLSYNTSDQYAINIGVYADSFTEDVNQFADTLKEEEFKIIKYESLTLEDCKNDVKYGLIHACIHVPDNFKIESNEAKKITFNVDPSKINLVWMIQETLNTKLNLQAQVISQELTQNILTKLVDTKTKINEESTTITSIKNKSATVTSTTETAKTGLTNIDLTAPVAIYDLTKVDTFETDLSADLNSASSAITDAISAIDSADMNSSEKADIKTELESAQSEIDAALAQVENNSTDTTSAFTEISNLVNNLNADLIATKGKLSTASETVTSTTSNLDQITTTISEVTTALENLQTTLDEINTNLESQKVTEASTITNPLITKIEKVSEESTYLNYMFSTLLILVIMFSSLLLGTTLVMMEKHSPAFLRNYFLPIRKVVFVTSIYLTNLILILLQILVIMSVSLFFMKDSLPSFPAIALILFITASIFTFLGMLIGYLFHSEETATLASISLGSIFLFVSGVILPLESVSPLLRSITYFNPFVIAEKLVKEILLFNTQLVIVWKDVLVLSSYAVVLFLVILIMESLIHQHVIARHMRHHHKKHRQNDKLEK